MASARQRFFPRRLVLVEERRVIRPSPYECVTRPWRAPPPEARLSAPRLRWRRIGRGGRRRSERDRAARRRRAPCISRSLIAAGPHCHRRMFLAWRLPRRWNAPWSDFRHRAMARRRRRYRGGSLVIRNRETGAGPFRHDGKASLRHGVWRGMGLAQPRVECRPQTNQGSPYGCDQPKETDARCVSKRRAVSIFIGQAAEFPRRCRSTDLPPQDLACFARDPAKIDGKLKGLRRGFDRNKNGRGAGAQSTGAHDAPNEASWPASGLSRPQVPCQGTMARRRPSPTDPRITHACLTLTGSMALSAARSQ